MANESGILVVGEVAGNALSPFSTELLGAARRLDGAGGDVSCALLGSGVEGVAQEAIAFGADKVYVVDDAALTQYTTDGYVQAMEAIVAQANPAVILIGQSNTGRDLAPRLAFRLNTAACMDAIDLAVSDGKLSVTRPSWGGNALSVNSFTTMPQIATVRVKSQEPLPRDDSRSGDVAKVDVQIDPSSIRTKVVSREEIETTGIRLEDAEVVVGGGRGVGSEEGFAILQDLANQLNGAVGATRAACDMGWRPIADQIGLTGKVVSPTLYIAVALSGASQHMAGCSGSKNVIAINKDPEANVFNVSRFGIVEDYKKVMPAFIEAVKKLLQ
jgi:electron transfer flavoprotein alpha subunit